MNTPSEKAHCNKTGTLQSVAWLAAVVAIGLLLLLPVGYWQNGLHGVTEVVAAALISLFSGGLAMAAFYRYRLQQPLVGLLLAMAIRLIPPLVVCLVIAANGMAAVYFGFVCYLLTFFMACLAVETYLAVRLVDSNA